MLTRPPFPVSLLHSSSLFIFPAPSDSYTLSLHDALPISVGQFLLAPGEFLLDVGRFSHRAGEKRSEEHTSELQSPCNLVCRLLLEKKNTQSNRIATSVLAMGFAPSHQLRILVSNCWNAHSASVSCFFASLFFSFHFSCSLRFLHSFPTRRSSDLCRPVPSRAGRVPPRRRTFLAPRGRE